MDAGQEVACHFTTRLASLGSKRLVVRADGVAPGDYDEGNNAVLANVEVMAKGFQGATAWYVGGWTQTARRTWTTMWAFHGPEIIEDNTVWEPVWRQQTYGLTASQDGAVAMNGRVMLRHFMDATELEPIVADVADLGPYFYPECRSSYFGNGTVVVFCALADSWSVMAERINGNSIIYTPFGYVWGGEEIAQGTTYRAELTYIDAADARQASLQGNITLTGRSGDWSDYVACGAKFGDFYWSVYQTCSQSYYSGEQYQMTNGY